MRVLVEQTRDAVSRWLDQAGLLDDVAVHVVMGGEGRPESRWRRFPERDAIFVGTLDMLLSRALNRGYAASRFSWPIDFGLFNSGCQWVFDEIQLIGPGLPTSRQLEGLRRSLGTAMPGASMWMSATVDERRLFTMDLPEVGSVVDLGPEDRTGPLAKRLDAPKAVRRLDPGAKTYADDLAHELLEAHRAGTRTIAVLNTVDRARDVWDRLSRLGGEDRPEVVLLHSRFRPPDRADRVEQALALVDPSGPGRIVVSTQVLEAGVDISATALFTEAAPWPSIVQRAGRCNRDGEDEDAVLLWAVPPAPPPYEERDVDAAIKELGSIEREVVTPASIGDREVDTSEPVHPVLRKRDLIGLFDTAPDLSGNDLDVGRLIREADDLDVQIAWRGVSEQGPAPDDPPPTRDELCPVPIGQARDALKGERGMWRFDHLDKRWVRSWPGDVRPGQVLVGRADDGGYSPMSGWDPKSKARVEPIDPEEPDPLDALSEATADDPLTSVPGSWIPLPEHLREVEEEVRALLERLHPELTPAAVEAAAVAGRLHDLGKAHPEFQKSLLKLAREEELAEVSSGGPWAKSASEGRLRHERRYFRHELASALALLAVPEMLEGIEERDIVAYLVAAHHGRVRLAIRSLPDETLPPGDGERRVALGIWEGDVLPATEVPGGRFPGVELDLSPMEIGDGPGGEPSWIARMTLLRDRPDLGPFRLAFLEAVLRLADWRVSAGDGQEH